MRKLYPITSTSRKRYVFFFWADAISGTVSTTHYLDVMLKKNKNPACVLCNNNNNKIPITNLPHVSSRMQLNCMSLKRNLHSLTEDLFKFGGSSILRLLCFKYFCKDLKVINIRQSVERQSGHWCFPFPHSTNTSLLPAHSQNPCGTPHQVHWGKQAECCATTKVKKKQLPSAYSHDQSYVLRQGER